MQEAFRAVGYGTAFAAVALIIFSPWMIRNYIWTKNPIYPLYGSFFSSELPPSSSVVEDSISAEMREDSADENQAMNHFLIRRHIYKEPLWKTLLIPIRIFFEGRDDNPKFFDGRLNPFLLLLSIAAFICAKSAAGRIRRDKLILLSFSVLYVLFAFFTADMRIRYVSPIIPPLVILATYGLHNLTCLSKCIRSKRACKLALGAGGVAVSLAFFINASYIAEQFRLMRPQDYVLGKVDRDFYIQQCRPEYAVIQYANRHLPDDAKILGLYLGNRSYYCDRELVFGEKLFIKLLNQAQSPDELLAQVKKKGFTHIVVNLYEYTESYGRSLSGSEQQRLFHFFRDKLALLSSHDGYQLFEI